MTNKLVATSDTDYLLQATELSRSWIYLISMLFKRIGTNHVWPSSIEEECGAVWGETEDPADNFHILKLNMKSIYHWLIHSSTTYSGIHPSSPAVVIIFPSFYIRYVTSHHYGPLDTLTNWPNQSINLPAGIWILDSQKSWGFKDNIFSGNFGCWAEVSCLSNSANQHWTLPSRNKTIVPLKSSHVFPSCFNQKTTKTKPSH